MKFTDAQVEYFDKLSVERKREWLEKLELKDRGGLPVQEEDREAVSLGSSQPNRTGPAMQWKEPVPITALSNEREPVSWVWEGFLAKGQLTLLSSLWKTGKTTLLGWFMKAFQQGELFVGKETTPCPILIISEESESLWSRRRDELNLGESIWVMPRPLNKRLSAQEWSDFLNRILESCVAHDIGLVILDTLPSFWPVKDENDAAQVTSALLPLNTLLERNLSLLVIHHDRKSGGDQGTASRGSGALPAHADIIVEFKRFDPSRAQDTRRVIKTYSRFEETPQEMVIELTAEGYKAEGTAAQVKQADKIEILLKILQSTSESMTVDQIVASWHEEEDGRPPHKATINRWLTKAEAEGKAIVTGKTGKAELWSRIIATQPLPIQDATEPQLVPSV